MFILCGCNVEARRALFTCIPLRRFLIKKSSAPFAVPFALPFRSFRAFHICGRSFALLAVSCIHAYLLPFLCSKRLQRSFQTVLSRFKRLKFSACTFISFAPFWAVCIALFVANWPFCVGWGWDYPLKVGGARRN